VSWCHRGTCEFFSLLQAASNPRSRFARTSEKGRRLQRRPRQRNVWPLSKTRVLSEGVERSTPGLGSSGRCQSWSRPCHHSALPRRRRPSDARLLWLAITVQSAGHRFTFDHEILSVDLPALLSAAKEERAERKRKRTPSSEGLASVNSSNHAGPLTSLGHARLTTRWSRP
jgi:hypothetical protein